MIEYELLVTRLLISVQDFAFRRRPMSLLVACAPAGLIYSAFPAGVFALPFNQRLEAPAFTLLIKNPNEFDSPSKIKLVRNFFN